MKIFKTYAPKLTSAFRPSHRPNHNGLDLVGTTNGKNMLLDWYISPVNGTVIRANDGFNNGASQNGGWGNVVMIKPDGTDYRIICAHLKKGTVKVKTGDRVIIGQLLGYMGNTGNSNGAHYHFQIDKGSNASAIDPYDYIFKGKELVAPEPPKPPKPVSYKYNVGDKVIVNGQLHGNSSGDKAGKSVKDLITNITRRADGTKFPYNITGDLGWLSEDSINIYVEPKPEPKPAFAIGDWVVPVRLVNYNGVKVKQYDSKYKITELKSDRAVLKANRGGVFVTWTAMNIKDIKKI